MAIKASAAWLVILLLFLADNAAAAAPAGGGEVMATAAWRGRVDDSVEIEPLPAEIDRVVIQRRVLQDKRYIAPSVLNQNNQGCIQSCVSGSQYSVPPPGSHCDRRFYNPGC
uniref:Uncharacterized protein n=1 Tax=Leersia perrieri TaxID=77586 RepID=A0A0D9W456_9ORYZ